MNPHRPPVVLAISGHDPTGGAGIQADIETIVAMGCHPATLVTCLTVQDTADVHRLVPVETGLIREQAKVLLADIDVAAVKVGLVGTPATAALIAEILDSLKPSCPLVLDTVLAAGGGSPLASREMVEALRRELVPRSALLTPNSVEARRLAEADGLDACAERILALGAGAVLITGTHEAGERVLNRLYRPGWPASLSDWPRLAGSFHGSGCTLASAVAAGLARGEKLPKAVATGLAFTWESLARGYRVGGTQLMPRRTVDRADGLDGFCAGEP